MNDEPVDARDRAMSFRSQILLALGTVAIIPLAVIGLGIRNEMDRRLGALSRARASALAVVTESALDRERAAVGARLNSVRAALVSDNRFRLAAAESGVGGADEGRAERAYLHDYAAGAMQLTGLSMLQIQDADGRIVSSGHFRNEYDRLEPELPGRLATAPGGALCEARTPDGPLLVLAGIDSLRLAGRRYTIVGGTRVDSAMLRRLAPDTDVAVVLQLPGAEPSRWLTGARPNAAIIEATVPAAFLGPIPGGGLAVLTAQFNILHARAAIDALRRSVDRWLLGVSLATAIAALIVAAWLAAYVSRPLQLLAEQTTRIDLDRLDVEFTSGRRDEIGALARLLGAMVKRLRASATRLRETERRATVGDLARQVQHDVKNGLVPLRHVIRHLAEVQREHPERLVDVFGERQATLEASLSYLDGLARSYGRLTTHLSIEPCDPNAVVRSLAAGFPAAWQTDVILRLDPAVPRAAVDVLALRRILENLIANGVDALEGKPGRLTITTRASSAGEVQIEIRDSGKGMTPEDLGHAFEDFYTTKPGGTGLGLGIVRRLASDLHARLHVETAPRRGTSVFLTLPGTVRAACGRTLTAV